MFCGLTSAFIITYLQNKMVSTIDLEMLQTLGIHKYSVQRDLLEVFRACEMMAGKTKRRHLDVFASQLREKLKQLEVLAENRIIEQNHAENMPELHSIDQEAMFQVILV